MKPLITLRTVKALFLCVALVVGGLACDSNNPGSFDQGTQDTFRSLVMNSMQENNVPGAVVGVWDGNDKVYMEAFGLANIEENRPTELGTQFRVGSITKSFTTTIILQLVDEGKISLDDTIEKYVPQVPYADQITIRMINNHTSGIANFLFVGDFYSEVQRTPLRKYSPMELVDIASSGTPAFAPPGSSWSYSNTNFTISGIIIEAVTGNSIEDEVRRRILEPLGLSHTIFPVEPQIPEGAAHGYASPQELADGAFEGPFSTVVDPGETDELRDVSVFDPSASWAAGGMISNMPDLREWLQVLAAGSLISAEMQNERLQFVSSPGFLGVPDFKYGLGIMVVDGYIGHGGEIFGYESMAMHDSVNDRSIVIALNNFPSDSIPALSLMRSIAAELAGAPKSTVSGFTSGAATTDRLWGPVQ